jgi:hypothetical protein
LKDASGVLEFDKSDLALTLPSDFYSRKEIWGPLREEQTSLMDSHFEALVRWCGSFGKDHGKGKCR